MKRLVASALLAAALSAAIAAPAAATDLRAPAASTAPAAPSCRQAGCTGFYAYAGIGGAGSNVDILGSGLGGSVFANGAEFLAGGGYQLWNGQFFAAIEAGGGWLVPATGQAAPLSSRWEGETLVKAGYGLQGLFSGGTGAPVSVFDQLRANVISPYAIIGGRFRSFGSGLATGAGLQYSLGSGVTLSAEYLHVAYGGTTDGPVVIHTDNSVRLRFEKHF